MSKGNTETSSMLKPQGAVWSIADCGGIRVKRMGLVNLQISQENHAYMSAESVESHAGLRKNGLRSYIPIFPYQRASRSVVDLYLDELSLRD